MGALRKRAVGAVPELGVVARWAQLRADDARRDRQHDLGLLRIDLLRAEEPAEHRQVSESGNALRATTILVADETRQHLGLAILEAQQRGRIAGTDLVGLGIPDLYGTDEVADFEVDLDGDIAIEVHRGLHLNRQSHIQILDIAAGAIGAIGQDRARGDDRNALPDQDLGLLVIARADARTCQYVGGTHGLREVEA